MLGEGGKVYTFIREKSEAPRNVVVEGDAESGRTKRLGKMGVTMSYGLGFCGTVPGGKYFYWFDDRGVGIYDQKKLKIVSKRTTLCCPASVVFSSDGACYAIMDWQTEGYTGAAEMNPWAFDIPGIPQKRIKNQRQATIRVRETVTGKTLLVFSVNDEVVNGTLLFTPSGDRLIFVGKKGITVWTLDGGKPQSEGDRKVDSRKGGGR
jgi:hypothetical protein